MPSPRPPISGKPGSGDRIIPARWAGIAAPRRALRAHVQVVRNRVARHAVTSTRLRLHIRFVLQSCCWAARDVIHFTWRASEFKAVHDSLQPQLLALCQQYPALTTESQAKTALRRKQPTFHVVLTRYRRRIPIRKTSCRSALWIISSRSDVCRFETVS